MREILQFDIDANPLVGTYHRAPDLHDPPDSVGILILNSGFLPRSAAGDSGAQLADHLANLGYHVFRFDMPGLGDSPGTLQPLVIPFFRFVAEGGHAALAAQLAARLKRQFALRGIVLMGNCGGAVTAVFAANRIPSDVVGVVQMDPDFDVAGSEALNQIGVTDRAMLLAKTMRQSLRNRLLQTPFGHGIRAVYLPVSRGIRIGSRRAWERFFGPRLPDRANVPLIRGWEKLAAANLPMLVLMADRSKSNPGRYDYIRHLLRKRPRSVTHFDIPGTSHSFATGGGKQAVTRYLESWLKNNVPLRTAPPVSKTLPLSVAT